MSAKRIILLFVAIFAGGIAAYLAVSGQSAPAIVQQVAKIEVPKTKVLITNRSIGLGQRIASEDLIWQEWPEEAVRPEYITIKRMPGAVTEMAGAVVRFEIFAGEPVREERIVHAAQGYLSAVIGPGLRAISIRISSESGAGGFIVPNDRVDVILTSSTNDGDKSATILENVRVLAIGLRLGETAAEGQKNGQNAPPASAQTFQGATTATVELEPSQAEALINAERLGRLSLALRSIVDFADTATTVEPDEDVDRNQVRLIRFGQQQDLTIIGDKASAPTTNAPVIQPARFDVPSSSAPSSPTSNSPTPPPLAQRFTPQAFPANSAPSAPPAQKLQ